MADLTKGQLVETLRAVYAGLQPDRVAEEFEYYMGLYPEGISEEDVAGYAERYPALRPLMAGVVERIVDLTSSGQVHSLWSDSENQAGSFLARGLALCDKGYCGLFADCILHQDLEHGMHEDEYIEDVMRQWGLCDETALLLQARQQNSVNGGIEYLAEVREQYGAALDKYFDEEAWHENDDLLGRPAGVDIDGNCGMMLVNKTSLELFVLMWDKGSAGLLLTRGVAAKRHDLFVYPSAEALRQAVRDMQQRGAGLGFAWQLMPYPAPIAGQLAKLYRAKKQKPVDIFTLFTPEGELTEAQALIAKQTAGQPKIHCQMVQLFRESDLNYAQYYCDAAGRRILKIPVTEDSKYLWQYDTDEELKKGFAALRRASGFELMREEEVEYPFDYMLKTGQDALAQARAANEEDFEEDE